MAKQTINIGASADDGTGDEIRTAFDKCNDNFTELYDEDVALDGRVTALEGAPPGSVASLDDVGDVNVPTPANGDVLTWDSTPGEWVPEAPTGGGSDFEASPTVPSAASFTAMNSATLTDSSQGLKIGRAAGGAAEIAFARETVWSSGSFTLTTRAWGIIPQSVSYANAVVCRNSTNGRIVILADYNINQILVQNWTNYTTFSANVLSAVSYPGWRSFPWKRLVYDGTNLTWYISPDGNTFHQIATATVASFLTASGGSFDQVGIGIMRTNSEDALSIFHSYTRA